MYMADTLKSINVNTSGGNDDYMNPLVASEFSASTAYAKGAYVVYQGATYRFTAAHSVGAWVGTDATQVNFANDYITTAQIDALFT